MKRSTFFPQSIFTPRSIRLNQIFTRRSLSKQSRHQSLHASFFTSISKIGDKLRLHGYPLVLYLLKKLFTSVSVISGPNFKGHLLKDSLDGV